MVAHSLKGEVFGRAQGLHGATYGVTVEVEREELDRERDRRRHRPTCARSSAKCSTISTTRTSTITRPSAVDASTTEHIARHIHRELGRAFRSRSACALTVTLEESPVAFARYRAPVRGPTMPPPPRGSNDSSSAPSPSSSTGRSISRPAAISTTNTSSRASASAARDVEIVSLDASNALASARSSFSFARVLGLAEEKRGLVIVDELCHPRVAAPALLREAIEAAEPSHRARAPPRRERARRNIGARPWARRAKPPRRLRRRRRDERDDSRGRDRRRRAGGAGSRRAPRAGSLGIAQRTDASRGGRSASLPLRRIASRRARTSSGCSKRSRRSTRAGTLTIVGPLDRDPLYAAATLDGRGEARRSRPRARRVLRRGPLARARRA